jgi:hypothetical protein
MAPVTIAMTSAAKVIAIGIGRHAPATTQAHQKTAGRVEVCVLAIR